MGFFGTLAAFTAGGACGVYAAQNYDIPNLKQLAKCGSSIAKKAEESYRKKAMECSSKPKVVVDGVAPASTAPTSAGDSQIKN